jgi:ubiquinone/menaquinone biosynthesis C-methylase UbiE
MTRVDYDSVAPAFNRRYANNSFVGVERALRRFVDSSNVTSILEIGCGTGHWLRVLADAAPVIAGVDTSWAMLERAHSDSAALLARATAESLPFADGSFDRAFCINALHHFGDQEAFLRDCRRVLSSGGAFLTVGLDPHTRLDQWWIYDYFPGALAQDQRRYAPTGRIRELLHAAGFSSASTDIVHHAPAQRPFELAVEQGLLDRRSTSQLMVISDREYEAGMERLFAERPILRSNLRLFGTVARAS